MKKILLMFVFCFASQSAGENFFDDSSRGWFWFETTKDETKKHIKSKTATEQLEEMQKELETKKAEMILNPSIENTKNYIQLQNEVFLKASMVNKNWQKALILYPELNIVKDSPISEPGLEITRKLELEKRFKEISEFTKEFTLLFFYSSNCKYCEGFAEVVDKISKKYGFKVRAITTDGKSLSKFKGSYDPDLVKHLDVKFTPALFAYSNLKGVITPISSGFLPIDLLEENILTAKKIIQNA